MKEKGGDSKIRCVRVAVCTAVKEEGCVAHFVSLNPKKKYRNPQNFCFLHDIYMLASLSPCPRESGKLISITLSFFKKKKDVEA